MLTNMTTPFGTFAISQSNTQNKTGILFFSGLGINSAYYDFYNVVTSLKKTNINLITIDLLDAGFSSSALVENRSLEQIATEILYVVTHLDLDKVIFCCHSYSAIYLLNLIENTDISSNVDILGFIGIDPTSASTMIHYMSDFEAMLDKLNGGYSISDSDINPNLSSKLFTQCKNLYLKHTNNRNLINEISQASTTITKMKNYKLDEAIPSLSILSTLNSQDYQKYGNPYNNSNPLSKQIILKSHHYIHWQQLDKVCSLIKKFISDIYY